MEKKYTIVFSGKTVQGENAETVKNNLLSVYDNDKEKIEILFSGNPVVIKKNIDQQTALEYKNIFEQFGAVLDIFPFDANNKTGFQLSTSPSTSSDQTHSRKITCPSCDFTQPPTDECVKCGIIIHKFHKTNSAMIRKNIPSHDQQNKTRSSVNFKNPEKKTQSFRILFRKLRIAILLIILIIVGLNEYFSNKHISSWEKTLTVVIYPINRDNSDEAAQYIESLKKRIFQPIEYFMQEEAELVNLKLRKPVAIEIAPEILKPLPKPPDQKTALNMIWWTIKIRYWSFRNDTFNPPKDVRIYVLYSSPSNYEIDEASMGLKKGKIGIVNAPADIRLENNNNLIITHEMLHTFGATDKYDYVSSMPLYPHGLADPKRKPIYPQEMAEIMAGRIPLSGSEIKWPENLHEVTIGIKTCVEINWLAENHLKQLEAEL